MGLKAIIAKRFAASVVHNLKAETEHAVEIQQNLMLTLVSEAAATVFGKANYLKEIEDYKSFQQAVDICDYEQLLHYIEEIKSGKPNILWPGQPVYLCKTSGTTSGIKYIPITKESLPHHIKAARNALLFYINETGNAGFINGKMIFLQGSPKLEKIKGIPTGRLSGIVAHHVPAYLRRNRLPSYDTNCIDDWETKVDRIVDETMKEKMTLISGIPPWVQMYFEKLLEKSGKKTIAELFPSFSLFVHGGVNFKPYKPVFRHLIGKTVDSIETYPASEGFIAYQDTREEEGLLLNCNSGIFYEFIPADKVFDDNPERLCLGDVKKGESYALVLNTNAGLWGYVIGDTVRFVSTDPYRLIVTGRIKHFISAFGEHVISEEVEIALSEALKIYNAGITDFHVAPVVSPQSGLPYHEWFIEFSEESADINILAHEIDRQLCRLNIYYNDLRKGNVLKQLLITRIRPKGFADYMKSLGKLGGQNKMPRLSNDNRIADALSKLSR